MSTADITTAAMTLLLDKEFNKDYFREVLRKDLWNAADTGYEIGAWITLGSCSDDTADEVPGNCRAVLSEFRKGKSTEISYPLSRPANAIGQVHTHPFLPYRLDPKPSHSGGKSGKGDWGCALSWAMPVYVISDSAIWRVDPDVEKPKYTQVTKDWIGVKVGK